MKWYQSIDKMGESWAARQSKKWAPVYRVAYALGSPIVTVLLLGAIAAWGYHTKDQAFFQAALASILVLCVGIGIKYIIARPRPATYDRQKHRFASYSFPSGHSLGSVLSLSLIARLVWYYVDSPLITWLVALLCAVAVLLVGLSRLYHGHHYLTDVLAGWIFGIIAVIAIGMFAF